MQSTKLVNRILLGSVAFSVSFVLGILTNPSKVLLTSAIAVSASYAGAIVAETRRLNQEKLLRASLQSQIEELEEEELLLYQSLTAATETRQSVEASINALQSERSQLLNRVSELHNQRNALYQELAYFQQQKQQQEEELYQLKKQLQQFERRQGELSQSFSAKIAQFQQTETNLDRLRSELECLQEQILARQSEQLYLEGEAHDLQTQIQVLEQRREQLDQSLLSLRLQKQEVESSLVNGRSKLKQLKKQFSEKQQRQEQLHQDLAALEQRKQQIEAEYHELKKQLQALEQRKNSPVQSSSQVLEGRAFYRLPVEWREWLEFIKHLSDDEQRALKAILERDEAALKRIADEKLTMPQVLINSINDRALEQFDDILLIGHPTSVLPEINDEYALIFTEPIPLYFQDFLNLQEQSKRSK